MHCCLSFFFVCSQIWGHAAILTNKSIWINLPSRVNEALYEFKIYCKDCIPWGYCFSGKILILGPHCSSVYPTFEFCTKWCMAANWFIFWGALEMPHKRTSRSLDSSLINTFVWGGWSSWSKLWCFYCTRSPISNDILGGGLRNVKIRKIYFLDDVLDLLHLKFYTPVKI